MKSKHYIWALDISIKNTGIVIVDSYDTNINNPIVVSVETNAKEETGRRLKTIADYVSKLRKKYPPCEIAVERGFYRFNRSTEIIFMAHGAVMLSLWDVPATLYSPPTIKKAVCGIGNAKKDLVRRTIEENYPYVSFNNYDESDAFGILLCHLKENGA